MCTRHGWTSAPSPRDQHRRRKEQQRYAPLSGPHTHIYLLLTISVRQVCVNFSFGDITTIGGGFRCNSPV